MTDKTQGTGAGAAPEKADRYPWWTLPGTLIGVLIAVFAFGRYDLSGSNAWWIVFAIGVAFAMICLAVIFVYVIGKTEKADPDAMKRLRGGAVGTGIVAGVLAMLFAGNQADKNYDYIVNGVRMSEWQEDLHGRIGIFFGIALFAGALILFLGWLFMRLRRLDRKTGLRTLLYVPLLAGAVFLGVFAGRGIANGGRGGAAVPEAAFVADPGSVKKGSLVEFGVWQQHGKEKTPVVWRVVRKKDGVLTLVSEYAIDAKPYGYEKRWKVTYAESAARSFLVDRFEKQAFTDEERAMIAPVGTGGGNEDLAALLTLKEAKKFLGKHTTCLPVPNVEGSLSLSRKGDCEFVLRPDDTESDDCYRYMIADLYTAHLNLHEYPTFETRPIGIRPVIRVRY